LLNRQVLKKVKKQLEAVKLGDLIRIEWFDASIGRSSSGGPIDVPVKSWGIYLGIFGERNKQIIIAQNNFRYTETTYDIDYTAIPLTWTINVQIISKEEIKNGEAQNLLNSFIQGKCRAIYRKRVQWRKVNSELD